MDPFNSRDNEEDIFAIVRQSEVGGAEDIEAEDIEAEDGSQFLNESGQGMEVEDEVQTSIECDDDSETGGHPPSGEVSLCCSDAIICIYMY